MLAITTSLIRKVLTFWKAVMFLAANTNFPNYKFWLKALRVSRVRSVAFLATTDTLGSFLKKKKMSNKHPSLKNHRLSIVLSGKMWFHERKKKVTSSVINWNNHKMLFLEITMCIPMLAHRISKRCIHKSQDLI